MQAKATTLNCAVAEYWATPAKVVIREREP